MPVRSISVLALVAGCGGVLRSQDQDSYRVQLDALRRAAPARSTADEALFADAKVLDRAALIGAVLARNPDIESARQGWRAAIAVVPAATALDDPMLTYEVAPLSVVGDAPFGQRIELSQRLRFPGKRRLAGQLALADAEAARGDYEAMRLATAATASELFDDYYLADRSIEVNDHHRELVARMKQSAEAQYSVGHGAALDSLAAEVELGHLEHERVMLATARAAVVAQINGLLHRDPDQPLPSPPTELPLPAEPDPTADLEATAIADRPEAAAAHARARAGKAAIALARRAYYPDVELSASYDSMWDLPAHRWMIGVTIELPVQRGRRRAEVATAEARAAQADADVDRVGDDLRVEVTRARRALMEGFHVARLYDQRLLPAARDQVDAALAGYTGGKNDFSAVISAEKELRGIELESYRARAELWRRVTALERALGRRPGPEADRRGPR